MIRVVMGMVSSMSEDDKAPPDPLAEVRPVAGDRNPRDEWREVFLHSRDRRPSDKAAAALSDMMTALLSDMVTELENLGGVSAPRVQAILHGEAATNNELEEIGYVCVELIRALKQV